MEELRDLEECTDYEIGSLISYDIFRNAYLAGKSQHSYWTYSALASLKRPPGQKYQHQYIQMV